MVPHFTIESGENVGWWRLDKRTNREHSDMLDQIACHPGPGGGSTGRALTFNGHVLRSMHFHAIHEENRSTYFGRDAVERTLLTLQDALRSCDQLELLKLVKLKTQRGSGNRA